MAFNWYFNAACIDSLTPVGIILGTVPIVFAVITGILGARANRTVVRNSSPQDTSALATIPIGGAWLMRQAAWTRTLDVKRGGRSQL